MQGDPMEDSQRQGEEGDRNASEGKAESEGEPCRQDRTRDEI